MMSVHLTDPTFDGPSFVQAQLQVFKESMWVGFPLLQEGEELLSTDAKVKLRVKKPLLSTPLPMIRLTTTCQCMSSLLVI